MVELDVDVVERKHDLNQQVIEEVLVPLIKDMTNDSNKA